MIPQIETNWSLTRRTVAVLEQLPMATVLTCGWMARIVSSIPTTAYGDPPAQYQRLISGLKTMPARRF